LRISLWFPRGNLFSHLAWFSTSIIGTLSRTRT
jgi:uncharacterized metal-binding protein